MRQRFAMLLAILGLSVLAACGNISFGSPGPTATTGTSAPQSNPPAPDETGGFPGGDRTSGPVTSAPPAPTTSTAAAVPSTTAAAPVGDARTASADAAFVSPSGAISCLIVNSEENFARCDLYGQKSWKAPQPAGCQLSWGDSLMVGTEAVAGCVGDYIGDVAALDGGSVSWRRDGDPVVAKDGHKLAALPYGSSVQSGQIRCEMATTGATCTNVATGHGFFISKESYRLF